MATTAPNDALTMEDFEDYLANALYDAGLPEGSVRRLHPRDGPGVLVAWNNREVLLTTRPMTPPLPAGLYPIPKD